MSTQQVALTRTGMRLTIYTLGSEDNLLMSAANALRWTPQRVRETILPGEAAQIVDLARSPLNVSEWWDMYEEKENENAYPNTRTES